MKPKKPTNDPLDRMRRAVEFLAPTTHRPMTTGLHEAIVGIFAGGSPRRASRAATQQPTRPKGRRRGSPK